MSAFSDMMQIDSIHTDFQKTLDKENHQLLSAKFEHLGFNGSSLNWIKSYLFIRPQVVE